MWRGQSRGGGRRHVRLVPRARVTTATGRTPTHAGLIRPIGRKTSAPERFPFRCCSFFQLSLFRIEQPVATLFGSVILDAAKRRSGTGKSEPFEDEWGQRRIMPPRSPSAPNLAGMTQLRFYREEKAAETAAFPSDFPAFTCSGSSARRILPGRSR